MKKTLNIQGMMCSHCEMHVKKALEAMEGVTGTEVSHKAGTAVVTMDRDIPNDAFIKAIAEQGYEVTGIQ